MTADPLRRAHQDLELWRLQKEGRTLVAVEHVIEGVGHELRVTLDGELHWSRMFGPDGAALLTAADEKRDELVEGGWR